MNYEELRLAVAENITDQDALAGLMTTENIETVMLCAPGLATVSEPYAFGNSQETYIAGRNVTERMYDPKSTPSTVDEVLAEFTAQNAYAAQQYVRLRDQLFGGGTSAADYFSAAMTEANEIEIDQC